MSITDVHGLHRKSKTQCDYVEKFSFGHHYAWLLKLRDFDSQMCYTKINKNKIHTIFPSYTYLSMVVSIEFLLLPFYSPRAFKHFFLFIKIKKKNAQNIIQYFLNQYFYSKIYINYKIVNKNGEVFGEEDGDGRFDWFVVYVSWIYYF